MYAPKRACLLVGLAVILVMTMGIPTNFEPPTAPDGSQQVVEPLLNEPEIELVEPQSTLAANQWYFVDSVSIASYGSIDTFSKLQADDGSFATLLEEADGADWRFRYVFQFTNIAYRYDEGGVELRVEGYRNPGDIYSEDLRVSWKDDWGDSFTYAGSINMDSLMVVSDNLVIEDSTFYVELEGAAESGMDPWGQNAWYIDYIAVRCFDRCTNLGLTIDRLYDSDKIYAYRGDGTNDYVDFTVQVESDYRYQEIQTVELNFDSPTSTSRDWSVRWLEYTNEFEILFGDNIVLKGTSYVTSSGTYIREVHFHMSFMWDHEDVTDLQLSVRSTMLYGGVVDEDIYSKTWDIETNLYFSPAPTMSTSRTNLGGAVTASGGVKYIGSSTVAPLSAYIDIVPVRIDPSVWTGSVHGVDISGNFDISCTTDSGVLGWNDFVIHVYQEGTTTDIAYITMADNVKTDAVRVRSGSAGALDFVIDVGTSTTTIFFEIEWVTDSVEITSASVNSLTWNGVSMSWNSGHWEGTSLTRTTPGERLYDSIVIDTTYGVTDVSIHPMITITHDRVKITFHDVSDSVVNAGDSPEMRIRAEYEFLETILGTGDTITVTDGTNDFILTWDATNNWFDGAVTLANHGIQIYTTKSVACSEGITVLNLNGYSSTVTYDFIDVTASGIVDLDTVTNIGDDHILWFTAGLYHTGTSFGASDSLTTNYGAAVWNSGNNRFEINLSYNLVNSIQVTVISASQTSEGITDLEISPPSEDAIWSTLMAELFVDDAFTDIGDIVTIWAPVSRAFDGTILTDTEGGYVILRHSTSSDIPMTYSSIDQMWYAIVSQASVGQWDYYVHAVWDPLYEITTIGGGGHFDGIDDYIDSGSDVSLDLTADLTLSVWFYGDGTSWGTGMYLLTKKDASNNNAQYSLYIHSDGTLRFIYYTGVSLEVEIVTSVSRNVWHNVIVTISDTTFNAWYDGTHVKDDVVLTTGLTSYPSVPVYLGAEKNGASTGYHFEGFISEVKIYNIQLSDIQSELLYQGQYPDASNLRLHLDCTSIDVEVGLWNDKSGSANDGTLGGTAVELVSLPTTQSEWVGIIWTQVLVSSYSTDNPTINVGGTASDHVTLVYAHDLDPVEDGTVIVNTLSASYDILGVWDFGDTIFVAFQATYNLVTYSGGSYGLNTVDQNAQSLTQEWDEIQIQTTIVLDTDGYYDIGATAEVRVTASLTLHNTHMLGGSDTLYMNGVEMIWNPSGYYYYRPTQNDLCTRNYFVNDSSAFETSYQISAISVSTNVNITWTGLIIAISDPTVQRIDVGTNATGVYYSVVYAHNMAPYDGTVSLNNSIFLYNDVGRRGYSMLPFLGDDTLGISYIVQDDETYCEWDGWIVTMSDPSPQQIIVGHNASGIIISVVSALDGFVFDGSVNLNDTNFEYLTAGRRGYTVLSLPEATNSITVIVQNDDTYCIWVYQEAILHLDPLETSILVSTIYDTHQFSVEIYLTNTSLSLISGWVNLTIGGENYAVYCDGIMNSIFYYTPLVSRVFTLEAVFEGDSDYGATGTNILLTANPREIVFTAEIPTEMTPVTPTPFGFVNMYDNDFIGEFQGVTYTRNFPINVSFSIWWTISLDYGEQRTYSGTWNITTGEGTGSVMLPWDLDGNGWLTSTDFISFFVIYIDGLGIYENITLETPVDILQPLDVVLQIPTLTYSDQSTFIVQIHALYDPSYTEGLDLTIGFYMSDDNTTWVFIGEITTTTSGWQSMNWTCTDTGTFFFKAETVNTELYVESTGYANSEAMKETTVLTIEGVGNFTYSDQGVLVALLSTDDGEPLSAYSVYLEILDGTWISIGSGLTNESGHVSILWTPTLQAGTYSIQVRMSLAGSEFYLTPDTVMGLLVVSKESTVVSIDTTTISQGYVLAQVTDDEGNPIPSIQVHFYAGSNRDYRGAGTTDNDGYTRLNITLSEGELLEALVNEDNFYYSSSEQVIVTIPLDLMFIGTILGSVLLLAVGITVSRKIIRGQRIPGPPSADEVSEVLKKERDGIPDRVKKHSEERLATLSGTEGDGAESSEPLSVGEVEEPRKTEDTMEWDVDT